MIESSIDDALFSDQSCFSCESTAATREHVFPKWLQNRFDLWNQRLTLPNSTTIPYRQLVVPLCQRCNNEIYSPIEQRIASAEETARDVWLWCNKIHYGMIVKHHILDYDRRKPGKTIADFVDGRHVHEWDRRFLGVARGVFRTRPDPFGSVFRFDFNEPQEYAFAHILFCLGLCVSFGSRGYVVFLADGQTTSNQTSIQHMFKNLVAERLQKTNSLRHHGFGNEPVLSASSSENLGVGDMLWFFANCLEFWARMNISIPIVQSSNHLTKLGSSTLRGESPLDKERFAFICRKLLNWTDYDEEMSKIQAHGKQD